MQVPRYWREQKERYNLTGSHCQNCDRKMFPRRGLCPNCRHESRGKMEEITYEGTGELVTYSRVHDGLAGRELETPYWMGIVELDEGPRVTAQLVDLHGDEIELGMQLEARFRKLGESSESGVVHYGYKFGPVTSE
jgi:uncharacterized OB-fold protein